MTENGAPDNALSTLDDTELAQFGASSSDSIHISTESSDPDWDAFVDHAPGGQHVQTSMWGQIKAQSGWMPVRIQLRRGGGVVAGCQLLVRRLRLGAVAFCPRGPLALGHDPDFLGRVLDELRSIARRERILYLKVQPPPGGEATETQLRARGFVASALPAAHVGTVRVDVRAELDQILAGMRYAKRKAIRRASAKGVVVRAAGIAGLPAFQSLLEQARQRRPKGFSAYPIEIYEQMLNLFGVGERAQLFLAEYEDEVVAGLFMVGWGDTMVALMGPWSGRHGEVRPNEAVRWAGMQWARERGFRYFDFDGIPESVARAKLSGEELPEEARLGETAYKLDWGSEVALFPRAYDRSFQPLLASLTRVLGPRVDPGQMKAVRRLRGRDVRDQ